MTEAELTAYAGSQGLRLDMAYICNTKAEIDACIEAQALIQDMAIDYYRVRHLAPHNPTRHKRSFMKLYEAVLDKELLVSEYQSLSPLRSQVKEFKLYAMDCADDILLAAKIGVKRRKNIRELLLEELQEEENI